MDLPYTLFLFLALIGAFAIWHQFFSAEARLRRRLQAVPIVPIREAKAGDLVRITGRVRLIGDPLAAPITRRPCVAFRAILEESTGGKNKSWREVLRDVDSADFLLEDATGRALVRTDRFEMLLVDDTERRSGVLNDPTPELTDFLARYNQPAEGWFFNRTLRYKEGVFSPDETVTVLGIARWETDPDPTHAGAGYRDTPRRLVIEARPDGPVLASDEPPLTRTAPQLTA